MDYQLTHSCSVCGSCLDHDGCAYLVTVHPRTNGLAILRWDSALAGAEGVRTACGHEHALEIVAHWMVSGRLDMTFTRAEGPAVSRQRQITGTAARPLALQKPIGELFINRDTVRTLLASDPEALASILDSLLEALLRDQDLELVKKPVAHAAGGHVGVA